MNREERCVLGRRRLVLVGRSVVGKGKDGSECKARMAFLNKGTRRKGPFRDVLIVVIYFSDLI